MSVPSDERPPAVDAGGGARPTVAPVPARPPRRTIFAGKRLSDGRHIYWWAEVLATIAFYLVYSAVRNSVNGDPGRAFANAKRLMAIQSDLGINVERHLQDLALHSRALIIAMNWFYGSLHFIVTAGVVVYLFRKWPDDYPRWRNTLAITTAIALVGFFTVPLMPPRLLPPHYGFVDTLARYPTPWSFNSGAVSRISNQFAAMPSVHCAWALYCACALVPRLRRGWAKLAAGLYPALTVTVIVLTANHYFLDAVGGFAVFALGYALARAFTRAGRGTPLDVDETAAAERATGAPAPAFPAGVAGDQERGG